MLESLRRDVSMKLHADLTEKRNLFFNLKLTYFPYPNDSLDWLLSFRDILYDTALKIDR
jgi:hypothetical protein